jgi:hypothetical protein
MNAANPPTAADVCRLFKLKPPAAKMLTPNLTPQQFFGQLVEAGHLADARRLLAHSLPPRRAVWWASLCLHHSAGRKPLPTPAEEVAFAAAGRWIVEPTEANRRTAEKTGWAAKPTTAAGILAMAAFLSGGSMSRPGLPPVHPEAHICGRLCGVVVYLASVRFDPARYKQHLRQYLAVGLDVARGHLLPPAPDFVDVTVPQQEPEAFPGLSEKLAAFLSASPAARA